MRRLIDANNAISVLKILSDKCYDNNAFKQAISVLESVPTIDAVEVVRCKDCIFRFEDDWCDRVNDWVCDDEFCSSGVMENE